MRIKFESNSARVKSVSFHPIRPWILAGLYDGTIQLWDYRIGVLLEKFDGGHNGGPVRGLCCHPNPKQPNFVSGGDDCKIKVWNYQQRRCLFTLPSEHTDFIRTVFYHRTHPWILSGSDDQTIRIWNWQSRRCLATLTGHQHYVLCAQFHPVEDLAVSCSMDQTIRIWDFSRLRQKTVGQNGPLSATQSESDLVFNQPSDVSIKHVLEGGHESAVNWVSFHPTMPLIVSGADDQKVRLWRYNESKAWEVVNYDGHRKNVYSCLFHPHHRKDLILSNGEDQTVRVWDMRKQICLQTYRRESSRFWVLTAHPTLNLFAAGHDNGLMVFKIDRERPAFAAHQNFVFYVSEGQIRRLDLITAKDVPLVTITASCSNRKYHSLHYNPAAHAVLLVTRSNQPNENRDSVDLLMLPKEPSQHGQHSDASDGQSSGSHCAAVWVNRNRFAVLNRLGGDNHQSAQIVIKNLTNETWKTITEVPLSSEDMFYGGTPGRLLLKTPDCVNLFDIQQRRILATAKVSKIKHVVWAPNMSVAALLCKHRVVLVNRQMNLLCPTLNIHESTGVKSGAWDESGSVFIYTTSSGHIKYALVTNKGDHGIICSLDVLVGGPPPVLYIAAVRGDDQIFCFVGGDNDDTRKMSIKVYKIDPTEYRFKLALYKKEEDKVLQLVRHMLKRGHTGPQKSIIASYLQKKGRPELALHFVNKDEKTRFALALECGNLEIALNAAKILDDKTCWEALGQAALIQGNLQVAEQAYQRAKRVDKLTFLYLVTGNMDKLRKMMKIAETRKDISGHYQLALFLGDVRERVRILKAVGGLHQTVLAYLTAATHGLVEEAEDLSRMLTERGLPLPVILPNAQLLCPPPPAAVRHLESETDDPDWSRVRLIEANNAAAEKVVGGKGQQTAVVSNSLTAFAAEVSEHGLIDDGKDDENLDEGDDGENIGERVTDHQAEGDGWGDLNVPEDIDDVIAGEKSKKGFLFPPLHGIEPRKHCWVNGHGVRLVCDHVLAGSFDSAAQLLHDQLGVINIEPFRPIFLLAVARSRIHYPSLPLVDGGWTYRLRNDATEQMTAGRLLSPPFTLNDLMERLQVCFSLTTDGKFTEAIRKFRAILLSIPLLVVDSVSEMEESQHLIELCREYLTGLLMETKRKELSKTTNPSETVKSAEMAAYFTHCNHRMQAIHQILTLRTAVSTFFKLKNFETCAGFCHRLLQLGPKPELAQRIRSVLTVCEKDMTDKIELNYDLPSPMTVCSGSFTPIYRWEPMVQCPFCRAGYLPKFSGHLCLICTVSEIGKNDVIGLRINSCSLLTKSQ